MRELFGFKSNGMIPFGEAMDPEEAVVALGKIIKPEVLEKCQNNFLKSYSTHYQALKMVAERYAFYLEVLKRDPDIMARFGSEIGDKDVEARVSYAIHCCITKGEKLVATLDKKIEEFPAECGKVVSAEESGRYILPDIGPPFSKCEITGVCICEKMGRHPGGSKPPYMNSCVGDSTMLLRDEKTADKRREDIMDIVAKGLMKVSS